MPKAITSISGITEQLDYIPGLPYQGREHHVIIAELARHGWRYLGNKPKPDSFLVKEHGLKNVHRETLQFKKGWTDTIWIGSPTNEKGRNDLKRLRDDKLPPVKHETLPPAIVKRYVVKRKTTETIGERMERLSKIRSSPEYVKLKAEWAKAQEEYGAGSKEALALRDRLVIMEESPTPKAEAGTPKGKEPRQITNREQSEQPKDIFPLYKRGVGQTITRKRLMKLFPFRDAGDFSTEIMGEIAKLKRQGKVIKYPDYTFPRVGPGYALRNPKLSLEEQTKKETLRSLRKGSWISAPLAQKLARLRISGKVIMEADETKARVIATKVQGARSAQAKAADSVRLAKDTIPVQYVHLWEEHPERYDIKGIDTPGPPASISSSVKLPKQKEPPFLKQKIPKHVKRAIGM